MVLVLARRRLLACGLPGGRYVYGTHQPSQVKLQHAEAQTRPPKEPIIAVVGN